MTCLTVCECQNTTASRRDDGCNVLSIAQNICFPHALELPTTFAWAAFACINRVSLLAVEVTIAVLGHAFHHPCHLPARAIFYFRHPQASMNSLTAPRAPRLPPSREWPEPKTDEPRPDRVTMTVSSPPLGVPSFLRSVANHSKPPPPPTQGRREDKRVCDGARETESQIFPPPREGEGKRLGWGACGGGKGKRNGEKRNGRRTSGRA